MGRAQPASHEPLRRHLFQHPASHIPHRRQAFTLVELLVSITIISILAALLLGAAAVAAETARDARTKALVARLHTLLMERYDGYRNRRVELNASWAANANPVVTGIDFTALDPSYREAAARLVGLRELMKLEMPDRWSDIVGSAVPVSPGEIATSPAGAFLQRTPTLYSVYARAYNAIVPNRTAPATAYINTQTNLPNTRDDIVENESAECLYLIIMNATGDGETRGLFKDSDIDDTDGDGAPEFVDGWGNPIAFLRWAPGFDTDVQLSVASLRRTEQKIGANAVGEAILADHDPFDIFQLDRTNARGWRLQPLIISAGSDEEYGIRFDGDGVTEYIPRLDPYDDVGSGNYLGEATDDPTDLAIDLDSELYADNIHNHNVGALSRKR
ncbi:type II secretion system protein [Botrimarina colliarenosi]|uniref:type II secretion system protein n=1 Tax=Botrimarina colliarenosi TaxID=2528001 RepID=UPI0021BCD1C7|nr:prepilin-type N-terminal cleavage/methylation domain-containing protein [Botrimarina colliarenosi]